jgi:hypothetical protein
MPAQCAMKEVRLAPKPRLARPTLRAGVNRANDAWVIVDERDRVVFAGTKMDCEDWLDWQDNQP